MRHEVKTHAKDTYFIDAQTALNTAKQNNEVETLPNHPIKALQLCYYAGDIPLKSTPKNCIHVPLENIFNYFISTKNRLPSELSFENSPYGQEEQDAVQAAIIKLINSTDKEKFKLADELAQKIKKQAPNFNDEKLRVFIPTIRESTVLKHVAKNISEAFEDLEYEVLFYIADELGDQNFLPELTAHYNFNPHIIIHIDFLINNYIHDSVFNFCWLQDVVDVLSNDEKVFTRKRDFFFHLIQGFEDRLKKKNITSQYQPFCINTSIFKKYPEIKKEKKIVFIGSSYIFHQKELSLDPDYNTILSDCTNIFEEKSCLTRDMIQSIADKYNKESGFISKIYNYLMRDYCVDKLCKIKNSIYDIEIYGYGWEYNPDIMKYYKGIVNYGEDISKIYNSATYGFCPGGYVLMQRTLECAASETIPLVLDARDDQQDSYDHKADEGIEFFHINDLERILTSEPVKEKDYTFLKEQFSYKHFAQTCIDIVKDTI